MVSIRRPGGGLVTLGESLAVLGTAEPGPLHVGASMRFSFAGAESTVAIGVARLGHPAGWIGRVGADEPGRVIRTQLLAEGVTPAGVHVDTEAPTAILVKQSRTADQTRVTYRRTGSAGSRLCGDDLPAELIASAGVLHTSGITPILSDSAAEAVNAAITVGRDAGTCVSFDVNYRAALWSRETAMPVLRELAERADIVFAGPDELAMISGCGRDPDELFDAARQLLDRGVAEVVVKDGANGAWTVTAEDIHRRPARVVTVVDPVGAGDAFAAGYLSAVLDELPIPDRLSRGALLGAVCVGTRGDWEGLPYRDELADLAAEYDVLR
ncbi:MAG TPA: sugar kinase [Amycolatopsis sp.]|nr:sugar kinase [Amycolatopsis sp.]